MSEPVIMIFVAPNASRNAAAWSYRACTRATPLGLYKAVALAVCGAREEVEESRYAWAR
jgi:hypothetical protein